MTEHDPGVPPPDAGGPAAPGPPDDPVPELPWYVGHPVVKVPVFALLGLGVVATQVEKTRWWTVVGCAAFVGIGSGVIAASLLAWRGSIPTPPAKFSPAAGLVGGVGFALGTAAVGLDALVAPDHDSGLARVAAGAALLLVAVAAVIEVLSWVGALPTAWVPPHHRPADAPAPGDGDGDGGGREGDA